MNYVFSRVKVSGYTQKHRAAELLLTWQFNDVLPSLKLLNVLMAITHPCCFAYLCYLQPIRICLTEAYSGFELESPVHFRTWTWEAANNTLSIHHYKASHHTLSIHHYKICHTLSIHHYKISHHTLSIYHYKISVTHCQHTITRSQSHCQYTIKRPDITRCQYTITRSVTHCQYTITSSHITHCISTKLSDIFISQGVTTHWSTLWHLNLYLTLRRTVHCNKQIMNYS